MLNILIGVVCTMIFYYKIPAICIFSVPTIVIVGIMTSVYLSTNFSKNRGLAPNIVLVWIIGTLFSAVPFLYLGVQAALPVVLPAAIIAVGFHRNSLASIFAGLGTVILESVYFNLYML